MRPTHRLSRISAIITDTNLTAVQKCIYVGLILSANEQGAITASTAQMQVWASTPRKATVITATDRMFSDLDCIRRTSGPRQVGAFCLIRDRLQACLREASETEKPSQSGTAKADQSGTHRAPASTLSAPTAVLSAHQSGTLSAPARTRVIDSTSKITTVEQGDRGLQGENPIWAKPTDIPHTLCLRAFEAFNEMALRLGLPQARTLSPDRIKHMRARLFEHRKDGYAAWELALANVERSGFLQGQTHHNFRADFEFILQRKSFNKLVEGGYGNGAGHQPPPNGGYRRPVDNTQADEAFFAAMERGRLEDEERR
jgi:hypothetical protein